MTNRWKKNKLTSGLIYGDGRWTGLFRLLVLVGFPFALLIWTWISALVAEESFIAVIVLLTYFLTLISAFATAVYYIKDIYHLPGDRVAFRYFMACFWGWLTPRIHIPDEQGESVEWEMVNTIGGPAELTINPGWVVLTESLMEPANILGRGNHTMSRHERIYEVVDLREQEGMIDKVTAVTRDGIPITVEKVKFNYRLWDSRWETIYRDKSITRNPYPYSGRAVKDYAYKRTVGLNGQKQPELTSWGKSVEGAIKGILASYIGEHNLDDVIAPRKQDKQKVREEIREKAYEKVFKDKMREMGTLIGWWDPGEFGSIKEVQDQLLASWKVDIDHEIKINEAEGVAQRTAFEELGRAEAEAELLISIIQGFDGIQPGQDKAQTMQNLILLRTAQVIKAFNNHPDDESLGNDDKSSVSEKTRK